MHIPFCAKKCAYCDFYSAVFTENSIDKYIISLKQALKQWGGTINRPIDTVYLGGGTPSLLNERILPLLQCVRENFTLKNNAEITLEINPQNNIGAVLENAKKAGINRISLGAQSGIDGELKTLGRNHSATDTENAVNIARRLGFSNLSLDLMIGLPESNISTLKQSLDFLINLNPEHISAYILKIEPRTAFYKKRNVLSLPDDDKVADQYLFMCEYLNSAGYNHYEISNFAKPGFESRHNLKYWNCSEYLGLGPSAHSFFNGKRFYYPADLKGFTEGNPPLPDGMGGTAEEKIMLGLRLKKGIDISDLPKEKTDLFVKNGLAKISDGRFSLTDSGMLVSNTIITELLENEK